MGIRHDVVEGLEKYEITKIDGQPTDNDLNLLPKDLTNAAGSVATKNGGEEHGHVGMVVEEAEYITFSRNAERFLVPTNSGPYPTCVDPDKIIRERQIVEHKAEVVEYETYLGVENYLCRMIVKSLDHEWLAKVESETMGFNHFSAKTLMTHLCNVGGSLYHMDITELIANIQKPWDAIKTPAAHFARGDKYERQLLKVGQANKPNLRLAFTLSTFQASGEFEPALREWETNPKQIGHLFTSGFLRRKNLESITSRTRPQQNLSGMALQTASTTKKSNKSSSSRHRPFSLPSWQTACKSKARSNSKK